jgi:hypothetical protein
MGLSITEETLRNATRREHHEKVNTVRAFQRDAACEITANADDSPTARPRPKSQARSTSPRRRKDMEASVAGFTEAILAPTMRARRPTADASTYADLRSRPVSDPAPRRRRPRD